MIVNDDVEPVLRRAQGDRAADSATRSGDQDRAAQLGLADRGLFRIVVSTCG
jgi:hypothetical protein